MPVDINDEKYKVFPYARTGPWLYARLVMENNNARRCAMMPSSIPKPRPPLGIGGDPLAIAGVGAGTGASLTTGGGDGRFAFDTESARLKAGGDGGRFAFGTGSVLLVEGVDGLLLVCRATGTDPVAVVGETLSRASRMIMPPLRSSKSLKVPLSLNLLLNSE